MSDIYRISELTVGTLASDSLFEFSQGPAGSYASRRATLANLAAAVGAGLTLSGSTTLTGFTSGSVLYAGAGGVISQDNAGLFFDATNNHLGIANILPQAELHVGSVAAGARVYNAFTDAANGEWCYVGDWSGATFPSVATFGSHMNGTGVVRDVNFVRGNVEYIRLNATGTSLPLPLALVSGATFGSQVGASNLDLSKHISLYSTTYGFGVTGSRLNYVGGSHRFLVGASTVDFLSITAAGISIGGVTSGAVTLAVPAVAGANTITLPAGTTNFSATGGAGRVVKQLAAGGAFTVSTLTAYELDGAQPLPTLLGTATLAGTASRGVCIMGNYAYVTENAVSPLHQLEIFDISNPTVPVKVGGLDLTTQGLGIPVVAGQILYTCVNSTTLGLQIIDVSNPKLPVLIRSYNLGTLTGQALALSGPYLYIGHGGTNATFKILDVSDPALPVQRSSVTMAGASGSRSIVLQGKYMWIATGTVVAGTGGLYCYDVSDVVTPVLVSTYNVPAVTTAYGGLAIAGKYLYCSGAVAANGLEVLDISDPAAPVSLRIFTTTAIAATGATPVLAGNYLFFPCNGANGIQVININDPVNPVSVGVVATVSSCSGLAVRGSRVYAMCATTFRVYDTLGVNITTIRTGSINTDNLYVDGRCNFNDDIYAMRSLVVGQAGIFSRGPIFTDASEAAVPISAGFGNGLVIIGENANTSPALKRSGAVLTVRLGDDSAAAAISSAAHSITSSTGATNFSALDVDAAVSSTAGKFGASLPMYLVAPNPTVGFNAYFNAAWKFGKGSVAGTHYAGTHAYAPTTGIHTLTSTTATGVADANATTQTVFAVDRNGLVTLGPAAGFTNAFPALRRNAAQLEVVTADNLSYAALNSGQHTVYGNIGISPPAASGILYLQDLRTPAAAGYGGTIWFQSENNTPALANYANIAAWTKDSTPGSEDGELVFRTAFNGVLAEAGRFTAQNGLLATAYACVGMGGDLGNAVLDVWQSGDCYNSWTDGANYEVGYMPTWYLNVCVYGTAQAGTGVARDVYFERGGVNIMAIGNGLVAIGSGVQLDGTCPAFRRNAARLEIVNSNGGAWAAMTSGAYQIVDAAGATNNSPFDVDVATGNTAGKFGNTLPVYIIAASPQIGLNTYYNAGFKFGKGSVAGTHYCGVYALVPTTGEHVFQSSTATGVAAAAATMQNVFSINRSGMVTLGPAAAFTASFPALKRNATTLEVRLGGDTAYAGLTASKIIANMTTGQGASPALNTWQDARLYNAWTDASNFENAYCGLFSSNTLYYGTSYGGTGTARDVVFQRGGVNQMVIGNGIIAIGADLGGAYPALRRSGTQLEVVTSNGAAWANVKGQDFVANGNYYAGANYLYLAGSGGALATNGPLVYGDANYLVLKPGANNLGWLFWTYSGAEAAGISTDGTYRSNNTKIIQNDGNNTGYSKFFSNTDGNVCLYGGGTLDPQNYYRNTTHTFQSIPGTTTFLSMNATKVTSTVSFDASIDYRIKNTQFLTADLAGGGTTYMYHSNGSNMAIHYGASISYYDNVQHNFMNANGSATYCYFGSGGTFNQSGVWGTISDQTLKEDVTRYARGLDAIAALSPVSFRYRERTPMSDEKRTLHYGLLAQEVAEIIPEIVGKAKAMVQGEVREVLTMTPGNLVFALVNAVKELKSRLEEVEGRLAMTEGHA